MAGKQIIRLYKGRNIQLSCFDLGVNSSTRQEFLTKIGSSHKGTRPEQLSWMQVFSHMDGREAKSRPIYHDSQLIHWSGFAARTVSLGV